MKPISAVCVEIVFKCNMTYVGTTVFKWLIQFNYFYFIFF